MKLPHLNNPGTATELIDRFYGIDYRPRIRNNSFSFTENLSLFDYPVLSTRRKRAFFGPLFNDLRGLCCDNGIAVVNGNTLYYNGVAQNLNIDGTEKVSIVFMGNILTVFPQGLYIDLGSLDSNGLASVYGSLSFEHTFTDGALMFVPTILESSSLPFVSSEPPSYPSDNDLWFDTGNDALCIYSDTSGEWIEISPTCLGFACSNHASSFKPGDTADISGTEYDGHYYILEAHSDFLVFDASKPTSKKIYPTPQAPVSLSRKIPVLDYVTEHGNRLWGCHFGVDSEGKTVNEIYCSKLGDPFNFYCYNGNVSDSFSVSVGSGGFFTGISKHLGYVIFFKEDRIYRLYGDRPSNYKLFETVCQGAAVGCSGAVVNFDETLYYVSKSGFMQYDGSLPECVSAQLGNTVFENAVAGADGSVIRLCATVEGKKTLFTYYPFSGQWIREDDSDMTFCSVYRNSLISAFAINSKHRLGCFSSASLPVYPDTLLDTFDDEDDLSFKAVTGNWYRDDFKHPFINKLLIRTESDVDSELTLFIEYDSDSVKHKVGEIRKSKFSSHTFSITPRKCDHFKLYFEGKGAFRLYSVSVVSEVGSEV